MQPSGPTPRSRAIQRGRGQFKEWGAWAGGCDVVEEAPGSPIVPRGEPRLWANSSVSFLKNIKFMSVFWSFPGGARSKETTCQCRIHKRPGFHPWVGKIPWRRAWQPTPVFLPGESHEKAMIQQLTGTDEAAGRCCLIGLQVLIKRLTGADQLADRC